MVRASPAACRLAEAWPAARGGAAEARRLRGEPGDLVQLGRDVELQLLAVEIGDLVEQRVAACLLAGELRRELRQQRGVSHLQRDARRVAPAPRRLALRPDAAVGRFHLREPRRNAE